MSLEQKVMSEMKPAMIAKDEAALRGLRAIKAAIINAKTEKGASDVLSEDTETKLLQKLMKQRKDALEIYEKESREDLAKKERDEIAIIEKFLPKQMSLDELRSELKNIIQEVGAAGPQDMGKVMGSATKALAGKIDGKSISAMVKELLG